MMSTGSDEAIVSKKMDKINIDNKTRGCYRDGRCLKILLTRQQYSLLQTQQVDSRHPK